MSEKEEVTKKEDKVSVTEIPGTARIRKLGLLLQPIELLELCAGRRGQEIVECSFQSLRR